MKIDNLISALRGLAPAPALKSTPLAMQGEALARDESDAYARVYEAVFGETGDVVKATLAAQGAIRRMRMGLAVKSVESAAGQVVQGWGILFTDAGNVDLAKEYFPRDAELMLDHYPRAPLWYEHGADPRYGARPIGERVLTEKYNHGIWAVHRLFPDHPLYERTLADLDAGVLSYSSDSVLHFVERGRTWDGGLFVWPVVGWSLVHRPAEPGLGRVVNTPDPDDAG